MEALEKWCRGLCVKQSLTLKCLARVSLSKVSSEKYSFFFLYFVGNEGLYSVGKKWEKSHSKKQQTVSVVSLATWPKSQVTHEIQPANDSSNFSMCFSYDLFYGSQKPLIHKFFTKLSHTGLKLNPTKIQENDWTKLQSNLTRI